MSENTLQQNIPIGWEEKSLGNFLIILKGKLPKKTYEIADSESVPYLSIKYLDGAEFKYAHKNDGLIADKNDLLVVADGSGSGRMYRGYYGLVSSTFLKISSQSPNIISNDYLEVIFSHLDFTKPRFRKGGAIPHFDFKQLKDVKILLPPLKEQQKIAEILCAVDEDIAKTQELIDTTEKLKKGLMQELVTIGDKKEIQEIAELNPKQINPLNETNKEFYYVDISSVKENVITGVKMFLGKDAPSRARRVLSHKDIIISTVRPNLRGFAYISKEFDTYLGSTGFCVLRSRDNKVDSKFLYYIIANDNFTDYLVGKTTGSNYPAVNPKDIGEYICAVPSLDKQQKIADILSSIDEKISVNKRLKEKLILLKKGLMQDLLSGRVRVNIN